MCDNNLPLEISQLKKDIQSRVISISDIERCTGIDQSQISRLLNNKYKRKSENYNRLCKFALNNCEFDSDDLKNHLMKKIETLSYNKEKKILLALYGLIGYMY